MSDTAPRTERFDVPQHTAIYADLGTIIEAAERAINLLHDAEQREAAAPDAPAPPNPMMADLMEKANDTRYSDEWIGNAFRAAFSLLGPEHAAPDAPAPLPRPAGERLQEWLAADLAAAAPDAPAPQRPDPTTHPYECLCDDC